MVSTRAKDCYKFLTSVNSFTDGQVKVTDWDSDFLGWILLDVSPKEGPYRGGKFAFKMTLGRGFPKKAPNVTCLTEIFHPNIDPTSHESNVCLNLLDEWANGFGLVDIIQGILFLLYEPNEEDPLSPYFTGECDTYFYQLVRVSLTGRRIDGFVGPTLLQDDDEIMEILSDKDFTDKHGPWDGTDESECNTDNNTSADPLPSAGAEGGADVINQTSENISEANETITNPSSTDTTICNTDNRAGDSDKTLDDFGEHSPSSSSSNIMDKGVEITTSLNEANTEGQTSGHREQNANQNSSEITEVVERTDPVITNLEEASVSEPSGEKEAAEDTPIPATANTSEINDMNRTDEADNQSNNVSTDVTLDYNINTESNSVNTDNIGCVSAVLPNVNGAPIDDIDRDISTVSDTDHLSSESTERQDTTITIADKADNSRPTDAEVQDEDTNLNVNKDKTESNISESLPICVLNSTEDVQLESDGNTSQTITDVNNISGAIVNDTSTSQDTVPCTESPLNEDTNVHLDTNEVTSEESVGEQPKDIDASEENTPAQAQENDITGEQEQTTAENNGNGDEEDGDQKEPLGVDKMPSTSQETVPGTESPLNEDTNVHLDKNQATSEESVGEQPKDIDASEENTWAQAVAQANDSTGEQEPTTAENNGNGEKGDGDNDKPLEMDKMPGTSEETAPLTESPLIEDTNVRLDINQATSEESVGEQPKDIDASEENTSAQAVAQENDITGEQEQTTAENNGNGEKEIVENKEPLDMDKMLEKVQEMMDLEPGYDRKYDTDESEEEDEDEEEGEEEDEGHVEEEEPLSTSPTVEEENQNNQALTLDLPITNQSAEQDQPQCSSGRPYLSSRQVSKIERPSFQDKGTQTYAQGIVTGELGEYINKFKTIAFIAPDYDNTIMIVGACFMYATTNLLSGISRLRRR